MKQVGIYLFWLVNSCLVNLLGIPFGTLCGLDSDGARQPRLPSEPQRFSFCCPLALPSLDIGGLLTATKELAICCLFDIMISYPSGFWRRESER